MYIYMILYFDIYNILIFNIGYDNDDDNNDDDNNDHENYNKDISKNGLYIVYIFNV